MSKVIIEVAGNELDLADDIGFGLNYVIDDVNKPESRNSNYSKTITLADSDRNRRVLGGLFDVNADFTFFNPNKKTDARIVIDSSTVLEGFLQLKSIEKESDSDLSGNKIVYKCTVSSKSTDFFSDIKGKELNELDFSRFSHEYTKDNIEASWSHTSSDVYVYPLMYRNSNTYNTQSFKPSIFHKAYLKRIAQESGYTLGGSILDESTPEGLAYSKEIIPFNGDLPTIPEEEFTRRLFQAGLSSDNTLFSGITPATFPPSLYNPVTFFDDDSTGGNFDNDNHYNTTLNKYTVDANGSYNIFGGFNVKQTYTSKLDILSITKNTASSIFVNFATPHGIPINETLDLTIAGTVNYDGVYTGGVTVEDADTIQIDNVSYVVDEFVGTCGIDRIALLGNNKLFFQAFKNGNVWFFPEKLTLSSGVTLNASNDWTLEFYDLLTHNLPNQYLFENDEITLQYIFNSTSMSGDAGVKISIEVLQADSFFKNETNATALTDGSTININEFIPKDIKQSDLITDLIKRYNAYISIDKDNDRKIIIDTRDSYYAKGGDLDWTNKKDFDSKDTIKLLSELQNKEMLFTYKSDDDDFNKNYSASVDGNIYGQKKIEFDNDFAKGEKKIETPFSPTPLVYNSTNPVAVVSSLYVNAPSTNIRVLYYGGVIDTIDGGSWSFDWVNSGVPTTTNYTTYPYAGHFDNPFTPTLDINFGKLPYTWYGELENNTNANLYNRFWSNYINQIDNGKLVTMNMFLNEVDINFIRHNLNTKIFIKDAYYYINKIKDYNPINVGLTSVEFLKIPDGISFVSTSSDNDDILTRTENLISYPDTDDETFGNVVLGNNSDVNGDGNTVEVDSDNAAIFGNNNHINSNSKNVLISGNNNDVTNGVNGAFIIGTSGKTITEEGEGWIGGEQFKNGGLVDKLQNQIRVTQENVNDTLGGVIDSTKEYFLDGIIDLGTIEITVPSGGIFIKGYNFDVSGLISSEDNYTMFKSDSPTNGSGNFLGVDYYISVTGTNSKVYDLYDDTGFNAFEFSRVNYINCTSLGDLHDYRQGLEFGTGRFGGTPELSLHGTWLGGYRITTSIVRSLTDDITFNLFKAGTLFVMNSRFLTDINVDLPNKGRLLDFATDNFTNPSTLQLKGCIVSRNGVINSNDTNITPNINNASLQSDWDRNIGIKNTFIGGIKTISTEVETVISAVNTQTLILGTWTDSDLQHFNSNFNYSFRHLGTDPLDFRVTFDFVLEGLQGDEYKIHLKKDSGATVTTVYSQTRTIDSLAGGRDVAYFTGTLGFAMIQNDFVYWEVENITSAANCTLELDSQFIIEER